MMLVEKVQLYAVHKAYAMMLDYTDKIGSCPVNAIDGQ